MNKRNTSGKVFDKMERLCTYLLAYDSYVPRKYRYSIWEQMRNYLDMAQACAEMAYLETDVLEKFSLVKDARKYFRMFIRYQSRCDMTGEFRFGKVHSVDMVEFMDDIQGELERWFAALKKQVRSGEIAVSPEHRV